MALVRPIIIQAVDASLPQWQRRLFPRAMSSPFGDYYLASYTVRCDRAEIRLLARRSVPGEPRATEIVFSGVAAYHFEHDTFGTVLGHVVEQPLEPFLYEHSQEFAAGFRQSGWPSFWSGSVGDALAWLQAGSVRSFGIDSAVGMRGWVLARDFQSHAASEMAD